MAGKEYQIVSQPGYAIDYAQHNLTQLIRVGYGAFNEDPQGVQLTQVQSYEYRNADKVYFALNKNESEVGSLSIKIRPNIENDLFWQTLQSLFQQDVDTNFLACEVYGIVVHPQVRREGIATRLLSRMIEDLSPQIIFGQTNVPEVVLLRSKVTKPVGYRTFYGFCEVTPHSESKRESDGESFIQASLIAEEAVPNEQGVYCIDYILSSNVPDTKNFPVEIQKAFKPVRKEQEAIGIKRIAVTTLVSVKDRILERNQVSYTI